MLQFRSSSSSRTGRVRSNARAKTTPLADSSAEEFRSGRRAGGDGRDFVGEGGAGHVEEREGAGDHLRTGDKVLGTEREEDEGDDHDSKDDEGAIENKTRNVVSRNGSDGHQFDGGRS